MRHTDNCTAPIKRIRSQTGFGECCGTNNCLTAPGRSSLAYRTMPFTKKRCRMMAMFIAICLTLNLQHSIGSPAKNNNTSYLDLLKYEQHFKSDETTTIKTNTEQSVNPTHEGSGIHQSDSDLYTLQLGQHNQRQLKHDDIEVVYDYKCPKQHFIHPCDCLGMLRSITFTMIQISTHFRVR